MGGAAGGGTAGPPRRDAHVGFDNDAKVFAPRHARRLAERLAALEVT